MGGAGRPPRDARTYGPVIMAAARERRVGEALRLTEEAEAAGLRLDEHAASAALGACARAGQWEAALAYLERMRAPGVQSCMPQRLERWSSRPQARSCSAAHTLEPRLGQTPPSPPHAAAPGSGSSRCSCCHACAPRVRGYRPGARVPCNPVWPMLQPYASGLQPDAPRLQPCVLQA